MITETHPTPATVDTTKPDTTKPDADGFGPITVKVGPGGGRFQRFTGRKVGESRQVSKKSVDTIRVYLTRKGNYVVHTQTSEWADYALAEHWTKDWKDWRSMIGEQNWGDFTVEVVDSLDALRALVPPKVHETIADRARHPRTQDLDV